jgi:hypothetical protein
MSLPLSKHLRKRLEKFAKSKELALASAARMLLEERLTQLEDEVQLGREEEWHRAQAWATYEKYKAGEVKVVPLGEAMAVFDEKRRTRKR